MASSYSLGAHYDELVRKLVETGRYASAGDVVRDGLRMIEQREQMREARLDTLRQDISEGLASGPPEPLDVDAIKADARRQRLSGREPGPRGA